MKKFALIDNNGEVKGEIHPADDNVITDGNTDPNNILWTYKEIPESIWVGFNSDRYWRNGTEWSTRNLKPSNNHNWRNGEWIVNGESLWEEIRNKRNLLLNNCDWTQVVDAPITEAKKQEWQTYRTQLRDIPQNNPGVSFVSDVSWPTPPA